MRHPGRSLFACWLTVVFTGAVVNHRHLAPSGHTHGFGWVVLETSSSPAEATLAHRHFVFFGIEFGAVPADTDATFQEGTGSPTDSVLVESKAPTPDSLENLPVLTGFRDPLAIQAGHATPRFDDCPLASHSPLVSQARSGILRL